MTDYNIRLFKSQDKDKFLDLYSIVFGKSKSTDWFKWKYESNPYSKETPIIVATFEDQIVAARPFLALPIRINQAQYRALQPCDTMVHPNHRRQGLFTKMTEYAIEEYSDAFDLLFNFPNNKSCPGYVKLGWEIVSQRSTYYRIENVSNVNRRFRDNIFLNALSPLITAAVNSYYEVKEKRVNIDYSVEVMTTSPPLVNELSSIYFDNVPDEVHVVRDKEFYRWRFNNPDWNYTSYIPRKHQNNMSAIVIGECSHDGLQRSTFVDTLPLKDDNIIGLNEAIMNILEDTHNTDIYIAPCEGISDKILHNFGFISDSSFPLSKFAHDTTHVIRTFNKKYSKKNMDITNSNNWQMRLIEIDTY